MIDRYTLPEMGRVWTDEAKVEAWKRVEVAACEGWGMLGVIPAADVEKIRGKKTQELRAILGDGAYDEVVHRDNLVVG